MSKCRVCTMNRTIVSALILLAISSLNYFAFFSWFPNQTRDLMPCFQISHKERYSQKLYYIDWDDKEEGIPSIIRDTAEEEVTLIKVLDWNRGILCQEGMDKLLVLRRYFPDVVKSLSEGNDKRYEKILTNLMDVERFIASLNCSVIEVRIEDLYLLGEIKNLHKKLGLTSKISSTNNTKWTMDYLRIRELYPQTSNEEKGIIWEQYLRLEKKLWEECVQLPSLPANNRISMPTYRPNQEECDDWDSTPLVYLKDERPKKNTKQIFLLNWESKNGIIPVVLLKCFETLLYHHPQASIMFFSNSLHSDTFKAYQELGYDITLHTYNLRKILKEIGAGLLFFDQLEQHREGKHYYNHYTDILRMALGWKFGGIYADLDIIYTNPLDFEEGLGATAVISSGYCPDGEYAVPCTPPRTPPISYMGTAFHPCLYAVHIVSGFFALKKESPFLKFMLNMADGMTYNPDIFNFCGPKLFSSAYAYAPPEIVPPVVPFELVGADSYGGTYFERPTKEMWDNLINRYYGLHLYEGFGKKTKAEYLNNVNATEFLIIRLLNKFCVICDPSTWLADDEGFRMDLWLLKRIALAVGILILVTSVISILVYLYRRIQRRRSSQLIS